MSGVLPVAQLRRFRASGSDHVQSARCGLCAQALPAEHRHLYDRRARSLRCACVPCHLLFDGPASDGHLRSVPDRLLSDPAAEDEVWVHLGVPVGLVFVVREDGRFVARYPGPAGVIDADIEPERAVAAAATTPLLGMLEAEVETLLIHRTHERIRVVLAPVSAGYQLAGEVRRRWRGFDGGDEVRERVEQFLADLCARASSVRSLG